MTLLDAELIDHLKSRYPLKGTQWLASLDDRKRDEIQFHNFEREREDLEVIEAQKAQDVHANKKYYSISATSQMYIEKWLSSQVPGKVFLDYACGNGLRAIQAAQLGARVSIGIDISDVSIQNARAAAEAGGVSGKCFFIQGDCEATELPDCAVDVILCSGMLHHLDLSRAYPELYRILRPNGKLLGVEALGHNPAIQLYRNLTPHLRTDWEKQHILKQKDIRLAKTYGFSFGQIRYWHFLSIAAVPFRRMFFFTAIRKVLDAIDGVLLSIAGLRLVAWQVTFELIRR